MRRKRFSRHDAVPISKSPGAIASDLEATLTYFRDNLAKNSMDYAKHVAENLPISSGVNEAACKSLEKQRLWLRNAMEIKRRKNSTESTSISSEQK